MIEFFIAFLIGSFLEYIIHKFILHNRKFKLAYKYHFSRHHKNCRRLDCIDPDYLKKPSTFENGMFEIFSLIFINLLFIPLFFLSFKTYLFLLIYSFLYYTIHRVFHIYPEKMRKIFSWHYDHHMNKDQNKNWGITNPIFDYIFFTRQKSENKNVRFK